MGGAASILTVDELAAYQQGSGLPQAAVQRLHKRFQMLDIDGGQTVDAGEIDLMSASEEQKRMMKPIFQHMFQKKDKLGITIEDFMKVFARFGPDKSTDSKLETFFNFVCRCPPGAETLVTRKTLEDFFEEHAPEKKGNIDVILDRFNTEQIVENLTAKYKAAPAQEEMVTLEQVKFLAKAIFTQSTKATEELVKRSFGEFDVDEDGQVTLEAFQEKMKELIPEAELASLLTVTIAK